MIEALLDKLGWEGLGWEGLALLAVSLVCFAGLLRYNARHRAPGEANVPSPFAAYHSEHDDYENQRRE